MESGDVGSASRQRRRRRNYKTLEMVAERDTNPTDEGGDHPKRPRLPKPRRPSTDTSASAPIQNVVLTTAETHVTKSPPSTPSSPPEAGRNLADPKTQERRQSSDEGRDSGSKKNGNKRNPGPRIPADTPQRRTTSSEDDSLRSVESKDKEKSPIDEYLTITMNSTPEETKTNPSPEETRQAKSSFIKRWTKKVAGSFTKSSLDKEDLDEERSAEGDSEIIQLETLSLKEEDEVRKPAGPKPKKKRHEIKDPIGPGVVPSPPPPVPPIDLRSPSSKRHLRRREKAGEFKSDEKVLGVKIHHTDLLPTDPNILHPVVRLTIMDQEGNFLVKTTHVQHKENQTRLSKDCVEQVMTQPSQVSGSGFYRLLPKWEEMFVIAEPLERFLSTNPQTIFFFEIMDFLPMDHQSLRRVKAKVDLGWHKIAWGFLKPLGADGRTRHVNRKLRLQLYRPEFGRGSHVYDWWKSRKWTKLNSTLYVTVKGILPPEHNSPESSMSTLRNLRKDELTEALIEGQLARGQKSRSMDSEALRNQKKVRKEPEWRRLPGQSCKVPNKLLMSLPTSDMDWFNFRVVGNVQAVKFSPCGMLLATGLDAERYHVLLIFEIPSGKLLKNLRGHHGLVYELDWKKVSSPTPTTSYTLASASADSTVRVWELGLDGAEVTATLLSVLLHPSYVYTLEFSPTVPSILVTGCFDSVVRIWQIPTIVPDPGQVVEQSAPLFLLNRHSSHINSVRFHPNGERLFSGDGKGMLCEWVVGTNGRRPPKLEKETKLSSDGQVAITSLCVDGTGRKLLVQLRQSSLKVLDVESFLVLNTFTGLLNERLRLQSVLSPCGNLVLSGSEESALYVWDADTGRLLSQVRPMNHPDCVISSVAYHPFDHYVAIGLLSSANEPHPILLYTFEYPANLSIGTVSKLRTVFRGSRSTQESGSGDAASLDPIDRNQRKGVDVSGKFRSILQKLDEVTGGTPQLAQGATDVIGKGNYAPLPPEEYAKY